MSWVWEEEFPYFAPDSIGGVTWHLKKLIPPPDRNRFWKISAAWIDRMGERKYRVTFLVDKAHNDRTFRSLKAAKAYALAIVTLET